MTIQQLPAKADFDDLLRHILIVEKRQSLEDVAAALGVTAHAFCSRLRNGGRFDPDDVAVLLRVIADERLPLWLFAGSGLLLVQHTIASPDGSNMTLRQRTAGCAAAAIAIICDLADLLESHELEKLPKAMIETHLDQAVGALLSIKLQLKPTFIDIRATPSDGAPENFAGLVRRVVLMGQGVRLQALAEALGLSYRALHARMVGDVAFQPAELKQLFRLFPDPRLADYVLLGTAYTPILRPAVIESRIDGSPIQTGLRSVREIMQFLEALLLTEDTGVPALAETASRHLDEAVRQLGTLQWNMTYIGHRGGPQTRTISFKPSNAA